MLSHFYLIPERNGQTDGQICYINIARQYADCRVLSLTDCKYSLNLLIQTRIE